MCPHRVPYGGIWPHMVSSSSIWHHTVYALIFRNQNMNHPRDLFLMVVLSKRFFCMRVLPRYFARSFSTRTARLSRPGWFGISSYLKLGATLRGCPEIYLRTSCVRIIRRNASYFLPPFKGGSQGGRTLYPIGSTLGGRVGSTLARAPPHPF